MSEMNKSDYDCRVCLTVGLVVAALLTGIVTWLVAQTGSPIVLLGLLCLVIASALFCVVDNFCASRKRTEPHPAVASQGSVVLENDVQTAGDQSANGAAGEAAQKAADEATAMREEQKPVLKASAENEPADAAQVAREAEATEQLEAASGDVDADRDGDGVIEGADEGTRPEALDAPRDGKADDLKLIKGVGPKLEKVCNGLGFWHFDQIAGWTADEIAWVDSNLEGFKGRVTRDEWVAQATILAAGGDTEFSKRN